MPNSIVTLFQNSSGIQRDGTQFAAQNYIDGEWVRFYNGQPRKIGGYKVLIAFSPELVFCCVARNNKYTVFCTSTRVYIYPLTFKSGMSGRDCLTEINYIGAPPPPPPDDGTGAPAPTDNEIVTQINFVKQLNGVDYETIIVVNNNNPSYLGVSYVYTINLNNLEEENKSGKASLLTDPDLGKTNNDNGAIKTTGGVLSFSNFLMTYNADGSISWSNPGDINSWSFERGGSFFQNRMVASAYPLVAAAKMIDKGDSISALLWSTNSLILLNFAILAENEKETITGFNAQTLSATTSILATNSVVEVDQSWYWIGSDCFYFYAGQLMVLPNSTNKDWFFSSVNTPYRHRINVVVVAEFTEIWWFFPKLGSEVNNHALIYNYGLKIWYDTPIKRSCGVPASGDFPKPIMIGPGPKNDCMCLFQHETNVDYVNDKETLPIESFFTYSYSSLFSQQNSENRAAKLRRLMLDLKQEGNMFVEIMTMSYPRSRERRLSERIEFTPDTTHIDLNQQGRIFTAKLISSALHGDYYIGQLALEWIYGDIAA